MSVSTPAERLRIALDLHDLGVQMMRARLSRERPGWTEPQVQAGVEEWLRERPGAEFGDCPGRPEERQTLRWLELQGSRRAQ